ncbi:UNVERIFIED_CONTAM: hypothetical protein FKN15_044829 [Acipenser sinensis]
MLRAELESEERNIGKYNIRVEDIMVREVRYVTLNCCYRDLHNVLQIGNLKTLALVESAESMILLGSIERSQLQALLTQQLGRHNRLAYLQERAQSAKKRLSNHSQGQGGNEPGIQRASQEVRFQISTDTSTFSPSNAGLQKPLKPALKRASCPTVETPTGPVDNTAIALKNLFCVNPVSEPAEVCLAGPTACVCLLKYNIRVEDIMVREVRYVTLNCCYRDLHNVLQIGNLKTLALVESAESMILLGSIERSQLQALLTQQLGRHNRLAYLQERAQSAKKRLSNHSQGQGGNEPGIQRASQEVRFQISTDTSTFSPSNAGLQKPLKPALKRASCPTVETPTGPVDNTAIALKNLFCVNPVSEPAEDEFDVEDDMTVLEVAEWEERQLEEQVNFNNCKIDPAPFQLVERTSLHK